MFVTSPAPARTVAGTAAASCGAGSPVRGDAPRIRQEEAHILTVLMVGADGFGRAKTPGSERRRYPPLKTGEHARAS